VNTTRTPEGGPYQRKEVIFASQPGSPSFSEVLDAQRLQGVSEVKVEKVVNDSRPLLQKYDPHHPDADAQGYVTMPNINVIEEMVNMISATRSYDANVAAVKAAKNMALKALEIGR
jgi:flagellar basal-body rod protein FlgC